MILRYCSSRWGNWKKAKVSGRPLVRDTSLIHSTSERALFQFSGLSVSKRGTTSYTPRPYFFNGSAKASSSSGRANVPGTGRPSGVR